MKKIGQWFKKTTKDRPFLSALIIILIVVVPGYFRLENAVDTANDTASKFVIITDAEQAQQKANAFENCLTRNTATSRGRDRFAIFFSALETIFTSNPQQTPEQRERVAQFIKDLRHAVPLDPELEDVDCNQNGRLDPDDYAP